MWHSLADPATVRRCWNVIGDIERCLLECSGPNGSSENPVRGPGLAHGEAGVALFFAYLHAARRDPDSAERALAALEQSFETLSTAYASPSLYGGFCGVGWAFEHLSQEIFEKDEDLVSEIDQALLPWLSGDRERFPYELIRGLCGIGTYLVERLPQPGAAELLVRVLDRLEETAEESEAGLTWFTRPEWLPPWKRQETPEGCYDLGVAHGVPGVLGFLAAARRGGVEDSRVPRLAEGIVRWLLEQKLPPGGDSVFPRRLVPGREPEPARTGWCYGDLGIAAVLLSAARTFGRPEWEEEALSLGRLAAGRSASVMKANEAGLCHGTAGIAHLFNRLYQATGDPTLKEAALAWLRRCLDRERRGEGHAGLLSWVRGQEDESWTGELGFLGGLAGIGLALLAAVSEVEPAWDRAMLVAVPPQV